MLARFHAAGGAYERLPIEFDCSSSALFSPANRLRSNHSRLSLPVPPSAIACTCGTALHSEPGRAGMAAPCIRTAVVLPSLADARPFARPGHAGGNRRSPGSAGTA